jgi:hypothetical protein
MRPVIFKMRALLSSVTLASAFVSDPILTKWHTQRTFHINRRFSRLSWATSTRMQVDDSVSTCPTILSSKFSSLRLFYLQDSLPPKWFQTFQEKTEKFQEKTEKFQENVERAANEISLALDDFAKNINKLQDSVDGIRSALKIESEGYTAAWVSKYVETKTGQPVPKGSYRCVKLIDKYGYINGQRKFEVELDVYGTNPLQVVAEYESKVSGGRHKEKSMSKIRLFASKVKFLRIYHTHNCIPPLAFFCVGNMDPSLIEEAKAVLHEVDANLVAFEDVGDEIKPELF